MTPEQALQWAIEVAMTSPCAKSKRGVVVFNESGFVAAGVNMPAVGNCAGTPECRAACNKICVHAEQDALGETLIGFGNRRPASRFSLLHVKVDGGVAVPSGPPSCAWCSKAIVSCGVIGSVWLLHEIGRVPADALLAGGKIVVSDTLVLVSYTAEHFHRFSLAHHNLPIFE